MGTDYNNIRKADCPECGNPMTLMDHKFRPPKTDDIKKWKVVKYLVDNGFIYHHVYEKVEIESNRIVSYQNYARYPKTLREAEDFVVIYKLQAIKTK